MASANTIPVHLHEHTNNAAGIILTGVQVGAGQTGVERRWKRWGRRRRRSEDSVWEGPLLQPDKYTIIYMPDLYIASYLSPPMDNSASTKVDVV